MISYYYVINEREEDMTDTKQYLYAAIRFVIAGDPADEELLRGIDNESAERLYKLSLSQDLAHVTASALRSVGAALSDELRTAYEKQFGLAVYRTAANSMALSELCETLEELGVDFIPLKGSVLRAYYPSPWMRTSCDIDILIKKDDIPRTVEHLENKLGYHKTSRTAHDVSLYSPSDVHLELHYALVEEGRALGAPKLLEQIFDYSTVKDGCKHHRLLTDAMFYLYQVAHTSKHLESAGSGIRQAVDQYLLDNLSSKDTQGREELLNLTGLKTLGDTLSKIGRVIFLREQHSDLSEDLEDYLMSSGVYGNVRQAVTNTYNERGASQRKLRYVLHRLFLPYETMCRIYPVLRKVPILLPIFYIYRPIERLLKGRGAAAREELRIIGNMDDEKAKANERLLSGLGLKGQTDNG